MSRSRRLHYPILMVEKWATELVAYHLTLSQLVERVKNEDNLKIKKKRLWNDIHAYLPYVNVELYANVCKTFGDHRKNNKAFCHTHMAYEKLSRVGKWIKNNGRSFFGKVLKFIKAIILKLVSFVGNLIKIIGKFISEKIFQKIIFTFNNWHDDKYGTNYSNANIDKIIVEVNDEEVIKKVDPWNGVPEDFDDPADKFYHKLMKKLHRKGFDKFAIN